MRSGPFKSRLARKIFFLFILATLIPLLIGSLVSYRHVDRIIQTDSLFNLQSASKEYGLSLFFRLKLAKDTLFNNSSNLQNTQLRTQAYKALSTYFSAIIVKAPDSEAIFQLGEIDTDISNDQHWKNRFLITLPRAENKRDVYIRLNNGIIGKVNSNYLWNTDALNIENHFCVVNYHFEKIFCQNNINDDNMEKIKNISSQRRDKKIILSIDGNDLLFTYWPLFMDHEFGIDDWHIIASQNNEIVSNRLKNYTSLFFPLIIFSLLLVTLLSSLLIRKNLGIINQLISGTKEVIKGNFDQSIIIDSKDELAELALSFNLMSSNMGTIVEEYKAFSEIDNLILKQTDTKSIINAIFNHIHKTLNLDSIIILNHSQNSYGLASHYSYKEDKVGITEKQWISIYSAINEKKLSKPTTVDIGIDNAILNKQFPDCHHLLLIPIINSNKSISECSYIIAPLGEKILRDIELQKLDIFANRIAIALQALSREKELQYKANHDSLTKLPNKNHIIHSYQEIQLHLLYSNGVLALLFLDLDHFKQVNDNYGHLVGDKLLKEFSTRLKSVLSNEEKVARLGGDEFVILVKGEKEKQLTKKIDKLCHNIINEAQKAFHINNQVLHIGASIGINIDDKLNQEFDDAIRYADIAMYFSKRNGGNRYSI